MGILNSNQLSGIENLDSSSTNPTVFSNGNAPKNLHVHIFYMAEALEPESEPISRKKEINSDSSTPPIRNLTPVTINGSRYHCYISNNYGDRYHLLS